MELTVILLKRMIMMFIFMGIGFLLYKKKLITEEGSKTMGNILIYLVLPCVIINGFMTERSMEKILMLGLATLLSVVLLFISALVSKIAFRHDGIAVFAGAFSNPGFFGIPLIIAALSDTAVFYVAPFIACLNIGQWTYGVKQLKGDDYHVNIKSILLSPFMIALAVGLIIFFGNIPIPHIIGDVVSSAAGLNTPIAMMVSGVYLAKADMKKMFLKRKLYGVSAIRLLLIPAISALVMIPVPAAYQDLKLAVFIATACPTGSNVAVYAQLHGKDYGYAVETVVMSTILSVITIPLLLGAVQMIW